MSDFTATNRFDFALAYWHTIGFMADEEIRKHFGAARAALKPDCAFLYTFQGPRITPTSESTDTSVAKNWVERVGKFILSENSIQDGYRDEYCGVIDADAGEVTQFREHQKAMTFAAILDYLRDAGFTEVAAFKDFDKNQATAEEFSIFVCPK